MSVRLYLHISHGLRPLGYYYHLLYDKEVLIICIKPLELIVEEKWLLMSQNIYS